MKYTLKIIGIIGTLIFGVALFFTLGVPGVVEAKAQEFIKNRIQMETNEKIDSLSLATAESRLGKLASKLLKEQEGQVSALKKKHTKKQQPLSLK